MIEQLGGIRLALRAVQKEVGRQAAPAGSVKLGRETPGLRRGVVGLLLQAGCLRLQLLRLHVGEVELLLSLVELLPRLLRLGLGLLHLRLEICDESLDLRHLGLRGGLTGLGVLHVLPTGIVVGIGGLGDAAADGRDQDAREHDSEACAPSRAGMSRHGVLPRMAARLPVDVLGTRATVTPVWPSSGPIRGSSRDSGAPTRAMAQRAGRPGPTGAGSRIRR